MRLEVDAHHLFHVAVAAAVEPRVSCACLLELQAVLYESLCCKPPVCIYLADERLCGWAGGVRMLRRMGCTCSSVRAANHSRTSLSSASLRALPSKHWSPCSTALRMKRNLERSPVALSKAGRATSSVFGRGGLAFCLGFLRRSCVVPELASCRTQRERAWPAYARKRSVQTFPFVTLWRLG